MKCFVEVNCRMCGGTKIIRVTVEQLNELSKPNRRHMQEILPTHSAADREMFISNTCDSCWNKMFFGGNEK